MTLSTLVKCKSMIGWIVMRSYRNVTLFLSYVINEHWTSAKYNMSDRIVTDIQFYIRNNTGANIVLYLWNEKHAFICPPKGIRTF